MSAVCSKTEYRSGGVRIGTLSIETQCLRAKCARYADLVKQGVQL